MTAKPFRSKFITIKTSSNVGDRAVLTSSEVVTVGGVAFLTGKPIEPDTVSHHWIPRKLVIDII